MERELKLLDDVAVSELRALLCDRFTPEELIEFLGVSTADVFERFRDECLEIDLEELM